MIADLRDDRRIAVLPTRRDLVALVIVIVVGAAARISLLDLPMRGDEAWSFTDYATTSLWQSWTHYTAPNNHLLHSMFMHISYRLFGSSPPALRLPALFAGVVMIAAAYQTGRTLYSGMVGVMAAALVAASAPLIEYSANGRGYTLQVVCALLLVTLAARLMRRVTRVRLVAFVVAAACGFWTVPVMAYPFTLVMLWWLLGGAFRREGRARQLRAWLVAGIGSALVIALLYMPPLLYLSTGVPTRQFDYLQRYDWDGFTRRLPVWLDDLWAQWTAGLPPFALLLLLIGLVALLVLDRQTRRQRPPLAWLTLAAVAAFWLLPRVILFARNYLFVVPLLAVFIAAGWTRLLVLARVRVWQMRLAAVVACCGLTASALSAPALYLATDALRDADALLDWFDQNRDSDDVVMCYNACVNVLNYQAWRRGVPFERLYDRFDPAAAPEHAYIVVNLDRARDVYAVLDYLLFYDDRYANPAWVTRLGNTDVYVMNRDR